MIGNQRYVGLAVHGFPQTQGRASSRPRTEVSGGGKLSPGRIHFFQYIVVLCSARQSGKRQKHKRTSRSIIRILRPAIALPGKHSRASASLRRFRQSACREVAPAERSTDRRVAATSAGGRPEKIISYSQSGDTNLRSPGFRRKSTCSCSGVVGFLEERLQAFDRVRPARGPGRQTVLWFPKRPIPVKA